jgi:hypothetical protein
MSQRNVELVRRIHERVDDRLWTSDLIADDIEYVNPPFQSHREALEAAGVRG